MNLKLLFFTILFSVNFINCSDYKIILPNEKPFDISKKNLTKIRNDYNSLNTSKKAFFDTKNLRNDTWTKEQIRKFGGKEITVKTEDGVYVPCLYFNRNSNKIVVMGGGFIIARGLIPTLQLFDDSDILWIGYWGREGKEAENMEFTQWYKNPPQKRYFSQRFSREFKDVKAAVSYIKNELSTKNSREYKEIIGHGSCYGCYVFVKAQAEIEKQGGKLFDKLILDSCWYSVYSIALKMAHDLGIIWNSSRGGAPFLIKWIMSHEAVRSNLISFTEFFFDIDFKKHSVIDSLRNITIPTFFISGSKDIYLNAAETQEIWRNTASSYKAMVMAPFAHTHFILKGKEVYSALGKKFIDSNNKEEFFEYLKSLAVS